MMVRAAGLEPAVCPVKDAVLGTVTSTSSATPATKCLKGERSTAPPSRSWWTAYLEHVKSPNAPILASL